MSRKFISLVAAASMAVTGIATPTRAGDADDLAKFLFGATTLIIIGKAIQNHRSDRDAEPEPRRPITGVYPPEPRRPVHERLLPASCRQEMSIGHARHRVYGQQCLKHKAPRPQHYPKTCGIRIQQGLKHISPARGATHHRPEHPIHRTVYRESCLLDHGYRIDWRR